MGRHPVGVKGRNLTSFPLNNTCKSSDSNDSDVVVVAAGSSIHELDAVSFVGVLWKGLILRKLEAEDSGRWYNNKIKCRPEGGSGNSSAPISVSHDRDASSAMLSVNI